MGQSVHGELTFFFQQYTVLLHNGHYAEPFFLGPVQLASPGPILFVPSAQQARARRQPPMQRQQRRDLQPLQVQPSPASGRSGGRAWADHTAASRCACAVLTTRPR